MKTLIKTINPTKLVLELLVVFLGVYGAFIVSEIQEEKNRAYKAQQIYTALIKEVKLIERNTGNATKNIKALYDHLSTAIEQKQRPTLSPLISPVDFTPHMWNATINSDGINTLDVEFIYQLSDFYNELNSGFEQIHQLRSLSENVLIPNLNNSSEEFYDGETAELTPKYHWYLSGIQNLYQTAERIHVRAGKVITLLEQQLAQ